MTVTGLAPAGIPPSATPMDVMMAYLGVRETGPNRGPWVDETLRFVGLNPSSPAAPPGGFPWCCSSFVWCAHQGGVDLPRVASVVTLWRWVKHRRIVEPEPGCGFVHLHADGLHGHVGFFVHDRSDGTMQTLSGNTNAHGSSNGDRVGLVVHPYDYVLAQGGGFFHMRPEERVA